MAIDPGTANRRFPFPAYPDGWAGAGLTAELPSGRGKRVRYFGRDLELRRLEVEPGGAIRVATRRGVIELAARADRDVPEGMVFIPFCFAEAAANLLTNPQLDPWGKIPEFKFCAAKVENADRAAAE